VARIDALAAWTESLRDTIAGAVGLEQAIPATAHAAAPMIRDELQSLSDRLRVRVPLPEALQRFADELDDSGADLIIAALILNARLRGPGLRDVLSSLAESARAELDMRQRVNAGRRSTERSVQIVVGV
jgi:Flp pilus assembly protein TadB